MASGAASHRRTYNFTQTASVCASTALTSRSQGTLSKNLVMSNSTTQSRFQQRSRHLPTASKADRPGRYPKLSGWNIGSTLRIRCRATTV